MVSRRTVRAKFAGSSRPARLKSFPPSIGDCQSVLALPSIPPFLSGIVGGVIGGVLVAFLAQPIKNWWEERIARREAARFFARNVDRTDRVLREFRQFYATNNEGKFEFYGFPLTSQGEILAGERCVFQGIS
jgi:hypothetical protein